MRMDEAMNLADMLESKKVVSGDNLMIQCPAAPFSREHGYKKDNHPSFGILVNTRSEPSVCNCFACGSQGLVTPVFHDLYRKNIVPYNAFKYVSDCDELTVSAMMRRLDAPQQAGKKKVSADFSAESFSFNRNADSYFYGRGIKREEITKYRLGFSLGDCRAIFPIYSIDGRYCGYVGRTLIGDPAKYKKYYLNDTLAERSLFGEHMIDPSLPEIVLVEGPIDAIFAARILKNVLALNGTNLSHAQLDRLLYYTRRIVLLLDGDNAGRSAAWKLYEVLRQRIPSFVCFLPDGKDPDNLTAEELYACYKKKFSFVENFLDKR